MKQGGQCRPVSFSRLNLWLLDRGTTPEKAKPRLLEVLRNRPPLRFCACNSSGQPCRREQCLLWFICKNPLLCRDLCRSLDNTTPNFCRILLHDRRNACHECNPRQWQSDERVFRHQPPIPSGCPQLPVRQGLYWNRWRQQLRLCLNTQQPGMSLTT